MFGFKESSLSSLNSNGVKEVAVPSITAVKESKFKVMDFFHSMKKLAGIYQNTKEPIFRELPFFIFTDNKDLSLEYQYRHEGVSDYITSPVNIPELIRRICYFVEE